MSMYDTEEKESVCESEGGLTLWFPGRITCGGRKEKEDWLAYKYQVIK